MISGNSDLLYTILYAAIAAIAYYYLMRSDQYRNDDRHIENSLLVFAAALAAQVLWARSRDNYGAARTQPIGGGDEYR